MLRSEVPPAPRPADLALVNGRVFTPTGWVQSAAVARNATNGLGSDDDVRPLLGNSTRVVDLAGHTVLPGVFDMHVHPTGASLARADRLAFPTG